MRIANIDPRRVPLAGWSAEQGCSTGFDVSERALDSALPKLRAERPVPPDKTLQREPPPRRNPDDPAIGKWAVVVRQGDEALAAQHLAPLLRHRASQKVACSPSGDKPPGLVVVRGAPAAEPDLWSAQIAAAAREKPRYLLLVGGPDRFPFEVQLHLDRAHRTGRLDLGATPGALDWRAAERWAERVVALETGSLALPNRAIVFAPASDEATALSLEGLGIPARDALADASRWPAGAPETIALLDSEARRESLEEACRDARPRLVLTATHGHEFPADPSLWGALTDAAFRPGAAGAKPFSAASLPPAETPFAEGAVLLAFACHSAGVPAKNPYRHFVDTVPAAYPNGPFVSPLPRALLAHPRGPIAFAGHVGAATALSFYEDDVPNPSAFLDFLDWALPAEGPLGRAMSTFTDQSLRASDRIANLLDPTRKTPPDPQTLLRAWIAHHDRRGYILLGDPATIPRWTPP